MTSTEQDWARGLSQSAPTPLGWEPINIQAIFSMGQDWMVTLKAATNTTVVWPAETVITASVYPANTDTSKPVTQWTAEFSVVAAIENNVVYIKVPYTQTDTVENGAIIIIAVTYPNTPTNDHYNWAIGTVVRRD